MIIKLIKIKKIMLPVTMAVRPEPSILRVTSSAVEENENPEAPLLLSLHILSFSLNLSFKLVSRADRSLTTILTENFYKIIQLLPKFGIIIRIFRSKRIKCLNNFRQKQSTLVSTVQSCGFDFISLQLASV